MFAQVLKFNGNHDPKTGQFASAGGMSGGAIHTLHDLFGQISKPDGGFTYQPHTTEQPSKGYALSLYPEKSFATPAKDLKYSDLVDYYLKNQDVFQQPDHFMGAWNDPASGMVFLDVSVVKQDAAEAHALALKHDQIAYFDLSNFTSVTVNPDAKSGVLKGFYERLTKAAFGKANARKGAGKSIKNVQGDDWARAYAGGTGASPREVETEQELAAIDCRWAHILKGNPNHEPAGSSHGGEFAPGEKERLNRISNANENYRLPNIAKSVPKDYVPPQAALNTVKLYRGVPASIKDAVIRPGDWVALDKKYAAQHGTGETGRGKVISVTVPTDHVVWAGTSMDEWFYAPRGVTKADYAYVLKFNPYHDDHGRFTNADGQVQAGHKNNPTVSVMGQALNKVGDAAFEQAVMDHMATVGNINPVDYAHEIERVARRIIAQKGFATVLKFNPNHDKLGEFAKGAGNGLTESTDRPGVGSHQGAISLRSQQADALPAQSVTHYSNSAGLTSLSANKYGSGIKGAEAKRLRFSNDPNIKNRVYFYLTPPDGTLPRKEDGLGNHVYQVKLGNLYDFSTDPAGILPKVQDIRDQDDKANLLESEVVKAGYDGYVSRAYNMAIVLGKDVPVQEVIQKHEFSHILKSQAVLDGFAKRKAKRRAPAKLQAVPMDIGSIQASMAAVLKFNPNHDEVGRFATSDAAGLDLKGAHELHQTLKAMGQNPDAHPNILQTKVAGKKIFAGGVSMGLERVDMPQIPTNLREKFLTGLGVKVHERAIDPNTLTPIQKEIDGFKTAKIYHALKEGDGGNKAILVSKDNFIIDGHHHWAAKVVMSQTHPHTKVNAEQVDMNHVELLAAAHAFDKENGIEGKDITKMELALILKSNPNHVPAGSSHGGEFAGKIPDAPGTTPIPDGMVRLYHQTSEENLASILKTGITIDHALGIEGPRAIYASETGFYGKPEKTPTVEFYVPKDKFESPFVLQDVPTSNIVAGHLPWHRQARYILNHPDVLADTLAGKNDDLTMDYGKAVAYVKAHYGKAKAA